jgi:hypothetical protein
VGVTTEVMSAGVGDEAASPGSEKSEEEMMESSHSTVMSFPYCAVVCCRLECQNVHAPNYVIYFEVIILSD